MIYKNGIIVSKEFNESFGDYTVIGTPTINGTILTDCSKTSYIKYSFPMVIRTSDSVVTFCGSYIIPDTSAVLWVVNNDYWRIRIEARTSSILFTNSSFAGIKLSYPSNVSIGDKLYYRATYTNGAQTLDVYKDEEKILSGTSSHENYDTWNINGEYVKISNICLGGYSGSYSTSLSGNTVQDLADFLVLVDDKPVFFPKIKPTISNYQTTAIEFYEI